MQTPFFQERGLDLSRYFPATLNLSIRPHAFALQRPRYTFCGVQWCPDIPAEDFSFSPCQVRTAAGTFYHGLVYYPHPETKPAHRHDRSTVEVIAPFIPGVQYGTRLQLYLDPREVAIAPGDRLGGDAPIPFEKPDATRPER